MNEMKEGEWVEKRTWEEFRSYGLLWWINTLLHVFGWSIVIELNEENEIIDSYPARVKYRGFDEKSNTKGYKNMTNYMLENSKNLIEDFNEIGEDKNDR